MSRHLTTYKRPSLTDQLAAAPSIEELAGLRAMIRIGRRRGRITADAKTLAAWEEALWLRVAGLIAEAPTGRQACYVFNRVLRWGKPAGVDDSLRELLEAKVAVMPNELERLARAGKIVEGVSSPAQIATALAARREELKA